MAEKYTFECDKCGSKVEATVAEARECCGEKMKALPLPVCETSDTAEHTRMDDLGDPCDDGRSGKI